ncbi:DUF7093 family protein [Haloplanus sp.]|uniref:DUF7093 family protein n=1 Tax=Haloplanus sp. TaxID=1961696 RepID=UPI00262DFC78|nr:hypothetical protein [Haloplanus sp.]
MGLRCLLGHEYANREVERDREERGDEVVVTYRTVETCDRCGERRIVSENKEVRSVQRPGDETMATGLGNGVTPDPDPDPGGGGVPADTDTDEVTGDGPVGGEPGVAPEPEPEPEPESDLARSDPSEPEREPEPEPIGSGNDGANGPAENIDDGIILDNDGPNENRGHGEWPDADDPVGEEAETEAEAEPAPGGPSGSDATDGATVVDGSDDWPDPERTDEGFNARASDADPSAASVGSATAHGGDGHGGVATNGAASPTATTDKRFVAADGVERIGDDDDGAVTEFVCPNCGYTRATGGSSMRAGDICPECHKGYIDER